MLVWIRGRSEIRGGFAIPRGRRRHEEGSEKMGKCVYVCGVVVK